MNPHQNPNLPKLGPFNNPSDAQDLLYRKMYPRRDTQEQTWRSSIRILPPRQPPKEKGFQLKPVMIAPLYMRESHGIRHFPPRPASDSFSLPPMRRIVQDDRWPGLRRHDRPAHELSLEASMTRKRQIPFSASDTRPLPDYTPGFFRQGAPVSGASFVLARASTPSASRLNAFVAERPRPLRRAADVEAARQRNAEAREVQALETWEREVLADCDPTYRDPDKDE